MSYLYVCRDPQNLNDQTKLEFNDTNLSSITVQELKSRLSAIHADLLPNNYELTFFGKQLKAKGQLSNYGIKTGANLFVLAKQPETNDASKDRKSKIDQAELQKMMVAIRTALVNSNFRLMLNRLYDKEFRENIVACTPSLRENIVAFCMHSFLLLF